MAVNDARYDANGRLIETTDTVDDTVVDNTVVPGTNPDAQHDPAEGATLGGLGGAAVGAIAGAVTGPIGALIGAAVGAVAGGAVSAGAVAAVDRVDNDGSPGEANTTDAVVTDDSDTYDNSTVVAPRDSYAVNAPVGTTYPAASAAPLYNDTAASGRGLATDASIAAQDAAATTRNAVGNTVGTVERAGNGVPGVQTGGHAIDGTPDTRGMVEKAEDKLTGDHIDDKTGKVV